MVGEQSSTQSLGLYRRELWFDWGGWQRKGGCEGAMMGHVEGDPLVEWVCSQGGEERTNRGGEELQPGLNCDHRPPLSDWSGQMVESLDYCCSTVCRTLYAAGPMHGTLVSAGPGGQARLLQVWVTNMHCFLFQNYTQYIPLSIYDLQTWMGSPSIFVYAAPMLASLSSPSSSSPCRGSRSWRGEARAPWGGSWGWGSASVALFSQVRSALCELLRMLRVRWRGPVTRTWGTQTSSWSYFAFKLYPASFL